jgi:hypothetical protein
MRRLLVISATLLALAGSAAPAQAGIEAQFALYKPLAEAAWEQYRCGNPDYPGAPAITAHLQATADEQPALGGWGVLAYGSDHYCTIWFKDGIELTDAEACKLIVHEYGHLAGFHHSDDPSSIMFPRPGEVPYAPCDWGAPVQRVVSPVASVKADAPARKALRKRCRAGERFMWGRCR